MKGFRWLRDLYKIGFLWTDFIVIRNPIQKFIQSAIGFEKPGILFENLET